MLTTIQGSHTITIINQATQLSTTLKSDLPLDFWRDSNGTDQSNWANNPRTITINVQDPNFSKLIAHSEFSEIVWKLNGLVIENSAIFEKGESNGLPSLKIKGSPVVGRTTDSILSVSFKVVVNGIKIEQHSEVTIPIRIEQGSSYVPLVHIPDDTFNNNQSSLDVFFLLGFGGGSVERQLNNSRFTIAIKRWDNGQYVSVSNGRLIKEDTKKYKYTITADEVGVTETFVALFMVDGKEVGSSAFELRDTTDPFLIRFEDDPSGTIMYGQSVTTTVQLVHASDSTKNAVGNFTYSLDYGHIQGNEFKSLVHSNTKSITLTKEHYKNIPNISQAILKAEITKR